MLHLPRPPTWNQAFSPFHPQNEEYWTEQGRIAPLSPVGSIALEPSLDAGAGQNGGACRERVLGERPMCCLFRAAPVGQPVGVTIAYFQKALILLVGVAGFEPATPSSRTRCATRLRYTPIFARGAYIASRPRRPQAQGALIGPALVAIVRISIPRQRSGRRPAGSLVAVPKRIWTSFRNSIRGAFAGWRGPPRGR